MWYFIGYIDEHDSIQQICENNNILSRLCSPVHRFLSRRNCRTVFTCNSSVVQNLCNCICGMYCLKEANKFHLFLIYTKVYVCCIIKEWYHIPSHVSRFPEVFVLEQNISWQHFQNCGLSKGFSRNVCSEKTPMFLWMVIHICDYNYFK